MPNPAWGFETRQVHVGAQPDPATGARAVPIYQTTAFSFRDSEHGAKLFALEEPGHIYTRIMNPPQGVFEARMASLESGIAEAAGGMVSGALAVASGQQAEFVALVNLAEGGGHIISSPSLYGGTYNLFHYTLPKMGIEVSFVDDPDDIGQWEAAIRPNTRAFYGETIANPRSDVFPIEEVAKLGRRHGIPLVIDNTIPSPYLCRPIEHGANIVVHSATKFIGGHGTAIGGVIVDGGNFDFGDAARFPNFNTPDPSYHGMNYWPMLGPGSFIVKARLQYLRDLGGSTNPFNSFLFIQGLETLSLRMERHVANAQAVAEYLEARDEVRQVYFAGLPSSPWYERAQRYLPRGAGSIVSFLLEGGRDAGRRFADGLELHSQLANIGDVRSLVIHPASTTHSQLSEEEQLAAGVDPGLIRLSVGIESIEDILADLDAGFRAAKSA